MDLRNILAGHVTDRTPEVVQGSPGTNVFLFWSGHGARDRVLKWGGESVEANPSISIHELYYQLATLTTGSHAGIYNDANYGNVYRNTLKEFLQ